MILSIGRERFGGESVALDEFCHLAAMPQRRRRGGAPPALRVTRPSIASPAALYRYGLLAENRLSPDVVVAQIATRSPSAAIATALAHWSLRY